MGVDKARNYDVTRNVDDLSVGDVDELIDRGNGVTFYKNIAAVDVADLWINTDYITPTQPQAV